MRNLSILLLVSFLFPIVALSTKASSSNSLTLTQLQSLSSDPIKYDCCDFNNITAKGDDGVLDIAFFGNSFVYVPLIDDHFAMLCEGKHNVRVLNYTEPGWWLKDHYAKWSKLTGKEYYHNLISEWDVVILNEAGNGFPEIKNLRPLVNLFGPDKKYYNLNCGRIMKSEDSVLINEDGQRIIEYTTNGQPDYKFEMSNRLLFDLRNQILNELGVLLIMWNKPHDGVSNFDPDVVLDPGDFQIYGDPHPNYLYGYCMALSLYCTLFDEPCIEQNNGFLDDEDIPGETLEEKEEYMVTIKNWIQDQLDFQKAYSGANPGSAYTAGDVNGDNTVNSKDLTRLMKYLSGLQIEVNTPALDVNGDGAVNAKDLVRLMNYLSGANVELF